MRELCELLNQLFDQGPASISVDAVHRITALAVMEYEVLEHSLVQLERRVQALEHEIQLMIEEVRIWKK